MVLDLLYRLAEWHALAKLRTHTDTTLRFFDTATAALGSILRKFQKDTCSAYDTHETPREEAARGRRKAARAQASVISTEATKPAEVASNPIGQSVSLVPAPVIPAKRPRSNSPPRKATYQGKKKKTFNSNTYKGHSLGHYARTIRRVGTTDSYSTQPVRSFIC